MLNTQCCRIVSRRASEYWNTRLTCLSCHSGCWRCCCWMAWNWGAMKFLSDKLERDRKRGLIWMICRLMCCRMISLHCLRLLLLLFLLYIVDWKADRLHVENEWTRTKKLDTKQAYGLIQQAAWIQIQIQFQIRIWSWDNKLLPWSLLAQIQKHHTIVVVLFKRPSEDSLPGLASLLVVFLGSRWKALYCFPSTRSFSQHDRQLDS